VIHAFLLAGAVLAVLAAIVLPINLAAFPRLSRAAGRSGPVGLPSVSVVIPARNEEADVERAVRSHLAQDYPDFQVIVVDDRSTDRTPEILRAIALEDPRLTVVAGCDPPAGWLGKPHALHLGARAAGGEILLFADADVRYDARALREGVTVLQHRRLDLLAFFPRFENRGFWENVLLPFLSIAVFLGFGFLVLSRRVPLAMGAGAGNLVRRNTYDAVGGHAAIRNSVVDDVRLAVTLKRAGFRVGAFRAEDRVAVRMYRGFREVWNGFSKNVAWAYSGIGGAVLFGMTIVLLAVAIAPVVVLAAALAGAAVPESDARLAVAVFLGTVILRGALAATLREPVWPAATHPLMAALWAGIIGRSLYWRYVRKQIVWRERRYEAANTGS
jgi:chlorobactene glucosyltransferase